MSRVKMPHVAGPRIIGIVLPKESRAQHGTRRVLLAGKNPCRGILHIYTKSK
jgi:hypothetical protein